MRQRIRLTGRRQLPRSAVEAKIFDLGSKRLVSLAITQAEYFRKMPATARIKLRFIENKFSETLEFGTIGEPRQTAELRNRSFSAPSCQLRVVASEDERTGILLGSTDSWTLRADNDDPGSKAGQGILLFQPADIAPRSWKVDIRDDDYPVVYIDKRIPDARTWVRNDPVFVSCVLPAIIREVFSALLSGQELPEQAWAKDWLQWAETLMPGQLPVVGDPQQKDKWTEALLDTFCLKHGTLDRLVAQLREAGGHGAL
ncbi:MAG: hypothetical protein ACK4GM_05160 [Tabrizicola sp.]